MKGLKGELFSYQADAVEYARLRKRIFICDEVGLGKTVEALAILVANEAFPALIICPAFAKGYWTRMVETWIENSTVQRINAGDVMTIPGHRHVTVINYEILDRYVGKITGGMKPKGLVCDESHYLKNLKTKRTKATKAVAASAFIRLMLTATPVENRPSEFASQLEILGQAGVFNGTWSFLQRYCNSYGPGRRDKFGFWDFSGAQNLEELSRTMRQHCFIRRRKSEVQKDLPEKTTVVVPMSMELSVLNEYMRAEGDVREWLIDTGRRDATAITGKVRAEALVKMEALKQIAVRGKMGQMQDWIESFLESDEKLVVFTTHTATLQAIIAKFPKLSAGIYGETPAIERERIVERFNVPVADGGVQLLVVNIKAGGVSIDLTSASNVVFAEMAWTSTAHEQAEGRLHRHGQKSPVTAWYFVSSGTVEEQIFKLLEAKEKMVAAAVDGVKQTQQTGEGGTDVDMMLGNDLVKRVADALRMK